MIKMSVYYPADGGSRFDHDYYRTRHMPLIQERLGDACLRYEIEKGIAGRETGSAPKFVAACHVYSPTLETFQEALGPTARRSSRTSPTIRTSRPSCRSAKSLEARGFGASGVSRQAIGCPCLPGPLEYGR